ncbi:MAG: hypothetical protein ABIQ16_26730 [Polyangiaceae bacterium]
MPTPSLRALLVFDEVYGLGRLQTDADRARVLDGLAAARGAEGSGTAEELEVTLNRLAPRWFVVRNAHASSPPILVQPRYAMSLLRVPMTRGEIRAARGVVDPVGVGAPASGASGSVLRRIVGIEDGERRAERSELNDNAASDTDDCHNHSGHLDAIV